MINKMWYSSMIRTFLRFSDGGRHYMCAQRHEDVSPDGAATNR